MAKKTPGLPKQKPTKTITNITGDIVNTYIQENPDIVTNHLRNERAMKAQRKQMNARSLLNKACLNVYFYFLFYIYRERYIYIYQTWQIKEKVNLVSTQAK